jgi:hypothetical protein
MSNLGEYFKSVEESAIALSKLRFEEVVKTKPFKCYNCNNVAYHSLHKIWFCENTKCFKIVCNKLSM